MYFFLSEAPAPARPFVIAKVQGLRGRLAFGGQGSGPGGSDPWCFPGFAQGDFLFWALLRYLLGIIFFIIFLGVLKQIQVLGSF